MTARIDYNHGLSGPYAAHRRADAGVLDALSELGSIGSATWVLEVGCGTGNHIIALVQRHGCRGWGINPSEDMLQVARLHASGLELRSARAEELPFDAACFDLVFSIDVIHHVEDRPASFTEAFRVLDSGGRLAVVTDDEATIRARVHSRYFPETVGVGSVRDAVEGKG